MKRTIGGPMPKSNARVTYSSKLFESLLKQKIEESGGTGTLDVDSLQQVRARCQRQALAENAHPHEISNSIVELVLGIAYEAKPIY
jgi:hypothetical protein